MEIEVCCHAIYIFAHTTIDADTQKRRQQERKKHVLYKEIVYVRARNALALHAQYRCTYVRTYTYAQNGSHMEIIARAIQRDCAYIAPVNHVIRLAKTTAK